MGSICKSFALILTSIIALSSLLCVNFMPGGVAQNNSSSPTFTVSIVASINNYSSTCIFGVNPNSTTAYSPEYDSIAPNPSSGVNSFFRYPNQTIETQRLSKFIVPSNGYTTWFLEVDSVDQYGSLTLTWNDSAIPSLTLEDGASKQIYADMNAVNNFSFSTTPGSISGFYIVYQSPTAPAPTPTPTPSPSPSPTPTPAPSVPIPTPSVPEFTAKYVNSSYEVPTSYSTDPYTGQNVTHPSYYVDNESIVVTIKNQAFASFIDNINGAPWNISLFLNVREKGHYAENWTEIYYADDYLYQTNSDYTTVAYSLTQNDFQFGNDLSSGGQVDFQVEALIGYVDRDFSHGFFDAPYVFNGQTSGWSNTQTVTVSGNVPLNSASPNPTTTPTIPEFHFIIPIIIFLIATTVIGVVLVKRKQPRRMLKHG